MTKLKITVTKEIIEQSAQCELLYGYNCAIALAIRDIFPKAWVSNAVILTFFQDKGVKDRFSDAYNIALPHSAVRFISNFDGSTPFLRVSMDPISFEIEIPDSVINQINIDELKPLLTNHPTLELVEQS